MGRSPGLDVATGLLHQPKETHREAQTQTKSAITCQVMHSKAYSWEVRLPKALKSHVVNPKTPQIMEKTVHTPMEVTTCMHMHCSQCEHIRHERIYPAYVGVYTYIQTDGQTSPHGVVSQTSRAGLLTRAENREMNGGKVAMGDFAGCRGGFGHG